MDPAFRLMRFSLDGELNFYFEKLIFIWLRKMVATYFNFFKRENKIRKKNPKCDSLFLEKVVCEKPDRVRGSGYLSERYSKDRNTPLNP